MSAPFELRLYNTRTRRKEVFEPLEPGHARIYTCGPTVYSPQHIGNMRPNLFADLLKRALLAQEQRVTHVINVTDVGHLTDDAETGDDKLELAAQKTGRRAQGGSTPSSGSSIAGGSTAWSPRCSAWPRSTSPSRSR
jgi:cysteinyl-tRNA synthetase